MRFIHSRVSIYPLICMAYVVRYIKSFPTKYINDILFNVNVLHTVVIIEKKIKKNVKKCFWIYGNKKNEFSFFFKGTTCSIGAKIGEYYYSIIRIAQFFNIKK